MTVTVQNCAQRPFIFAVQNKGYLPITDANLVMYVWIWSSLLVMTIGNVAFDTSKGAVLTIFFV